MKKTYGWRKCIECGNRFWWREIKSEHGFPIDPKRCNDCVDWYKERNQQ